MNKYLLHKGNLFRQRSVEAGNPASQEELDAIAMQQQASPDNIPPHMLPNGMESLDSQMEQDEVPQQSFGRMSIMKNKDSQPEYETIPISKDDARLILDNKHPDTKLPSDSELRKEAIRNLLLKINSGE